MKIGVNATFLHEKPTGLGVFTQEILRGLFSLNRDLAVFSPVSVKGVAEECIYKVPPYIKGSLKFSGNLMRALYLNGVLPLKYRSRKIDVLFCPMMEYPFVPLVPLVVHVHDLHPIKFASQFKRASVHFRVALKRLEKAAQRVTVSSEFVRNELLAATKIGAEIIDVVPLAYNHTLFYPRGPQMKEEFLRKYSLAGGYILTVGNLFPYKNLGTLIKAFRSIKGEIGQSLVVVGRKEFSADKIETDGRILYADYVPDEDLAKFYSFADLLVHPSLSEGFGLPPLEAMASGTPIISSSAGSLPEVMGDAGILFDPLDADSIGELMLKVLGDGDLRRDMVERGLIRASKFSWEKTAAGILKACEKVMRA